MTKTPDNIELPSPREIVFAEHYLQCNCGVEAARRAGYTGTSASLRVTARRLLDKAKIKAYILGRLSELQMDTDEVWKRLSDHARADIRDFLTVKEKEYPLWSPKARYWRGDIVERDVRGTLYAFKALAQSGPQGKGKSNTRKRRLSVADEDEAGWGEPIDPSTDGVGVYWQRIEREKYVTVDMPKAIEGYKTGVIRKFGQNRHGKPEIELTDPLVALQLIGRKLQMFVDRLKVDEDDEAASAREELTRKLTELERRLSESA